MVQIVKYQTGKDPAGAPSEKGPGKTLASLVTLSIAALFGSLVVGLKGPNWIEEAGMKENPTLSVPLLSKVYSIATFGLNNNNLSVLEDCMARSLQKKNYAAFGTFADTYKQALLNLHPEPKAIDGRDISEGLDRFEDKIGQIIHLYINDPETLNYLYDRHKIAFDRFGSDIFHEKAYFPPASPETAQFFLDKGIDAKEHHVLETAIVLEHFDFANALIKGGVKTSFKEIDRQRELETKKGWTFQQLRWMNKNGIDIHGEDFESTIVAAQAGGTQALRYLMSHGADRQEVKDHALMRAVAAQKLETASYLARIGARADAKTMEMLCEIEAADPTDVLEIAASRAPGLSPTCN